MRLMYISKEGIDDLKLNFDTYKKHFTDDTNEWFVEYFNKKEWLHESNIECSDFRLSLDDDYNVSDRKNVEIVYEALGHLNPVQAYDERIWAGMLFSHFWYYVKYRRGDKLATDDPKTVLNSFVFMNGIKRSAFVNCMSRLWWTGYLLYDAGSSSPYRYVDLVCENAYASTILLLSSSSFFSNKTIGFGILDAILEHRKKGYKIERTHYVYPTTRYLNKIGGITLLDMLSRNHVKEICSIQLMKWEANHGEGKSDDTQINQESSSDTGNVSNTVIEEKFSEFKQLSLFDL